MWLNIIAVLASTVGLYYSFRIYKKVRHSSILFMLIAFAYAIFSRTLSILTKEGISDLPSREIAIPVYILFALGAFGIYRGGEAGDEPTAEADR